MLTLMHSTQVPHVEPVQDEVGVMPLLMCKDNFAVEPSFWFGIRSVNPSFDLFVGRKLM